MPARHRYFGWLNQVVLCNRLFPWWTEMAGITLPRLPWYNLNVKWRANREQM
jgi:hypothetical protein